MAEAGQMEKHGFQTEVKQFLHQLDPKFLGLPRQIPRMDNVSVGKLFQPKAILDACLKATGGVHCVVSVHELLFVRMDGKTYFAHHRISKRSIFFTAKPRPASVAQ